MNKVNVLLVDDDRDIGTFMKHKLSREAPHFTFAFVESGQECLEYIAGQEVDCILSDYQMPGMDGMELLLAVRAQGNDVPFIFLTGQGNEEVAREAFKNGAYDYFTKEIGFAHFARIINSVEQAVKGREAEAERSRADEALRASEQRLHLHVQQTPLGAIEWDVDFRVVSWNPAAEKIFGFTAEEAIGRISMFIIPDSARPHVDHVWDDLINLRGGERSTNDNLTKDGRIILCEWYNTPLVAPDGSVIGVASFVQDVTERQKAENALAESEDKFRNLVEKSLVGVYLIQDEDTKYVFKYVNSMMAEILGYSVDELTGMDVLETGLPEDMPLVKENLRRRIEGEIESISYGFRCRKKSGEVIDAMVYGSKTTYMGRPAVIGTLLDVTERKKAVDALTESEEKFRHLVEQAADAFFLHDISGRIVDVNQQACDSLGYTREELLGLSVQDIEMNFDSKALAGLWGEMTPSRPITVEGTHRRKDGTTFPVEVRVGSLNVAGEQLMLALSRDVTDRRKAEEALQEERNLFIAGPNVAFKWKAAEGWPVEYVSPNVLEQFGYTPEYFIRDKALYADLIHPDDLPRVAEEVKTYGEEMVPYFEQEYRIARADGEYRWVYDFTVVVRDANGVITGYQGHIHDKTERKEVVEELNRQRDYLNKVIESLTHPFYVIDAASYEIVMANTASGYDTSLDHKTCYEVTHKRSEPCGGDGHMCPLDMVKKTKGPVIVDHTHYDEEGNERTIEVHGYPILDDKGDVVQMIEYALDITERVKAEDALRASRKFLEAIIETEPECVKLIAPDGTLQLMNRAGLDMIQADSLEQVKGKQVYGLIAPEHREAFKRVSEKVFRGEEAQLVFDMIGFGGRRLTLETHTVPLRNEKDEIIALLGVTRDITERRRADEALRLSEERIRSIMETTDEWIWEVDTAGVHSYSNTAVESILGYSVEEIVGRDALELMHEEDKARVAEMLPVLVSEKKGWRRLILRWRHKDGTYRYLESNAVPVLDQKGEVAGFRGADRDVTERKQAENALKESEAKFRALVEDADVGVIIIQDGKSVYRNPKQARILGYTPEELAGMNNYLQFIHPDDHNIVREAVSKLFGDKREYHTFEFRVIRKDGGIANLESHGCLTEYKGRPAIIGISIDITARKKAEEALLESEARFRALTESTSDWIWETDASGSYTYSSPKVREILGYEPDELIGKSAFDLMPPEEAASVEAEFRKLVLSQLPIERLENVNITKDGRRVVLETSGVPFFDSKGAFSGYRGIDRDITERKKAETDLRRSEGRLKAILNNIPDFAWLKDTESRFIAVNEAVAKACGVSSDELVGKTDLDLWPRELADMYRADDMEVVKSGKRKSVVEPMVGKDGEKKWIATIKSPIYDEEGNVAGTAGIARDITEMKRAEEMLQFRNVLLSIQQEASLDGILVVDEKDEIISYNKRFAEMWGIPPEVMDKRSGELAIQSVLHNLVDPDEFVERINYLYSHRTKKSTEEVQLKDGRTLERYSAPMFSQDGRYYGRVWYYRDISERKKAEHQRADFYAMLSHDLKSPLMTLTGYADILDAQSGKFDEEIRAIIGSIRISCEKLLRLIEDLLSVSRFEAEKMGLVLYPASLSRTLEEACAGLETEMKKKQKFRLELADDLPEKLIMDKKYVQRAVTNLLQNAVNYTPRGGEITLRAETRQEGGLSFVVVSVSDSGPGIPPKEHSRIFDKYYRVSGTTGVKGTGLGLAIVKAVAEQHGGRVELESEPGKGSTFRIVLPLSGKFQAAQENANIA